MAYTGQPISLTSGSAPAGVAPQPFVIVGNVPAGSIAHASTSSYGTVKQAANISQVGSTFTDLAAATAAYNALLTALKNANIMVGP